MAIASTMMRRILVDHALAHRAAKRDAELEPISTTLLDPTTPASTTTWWPCTKRCLRWKRSPRAAKVWS